MKLFGFCSLYTSKDESGVFVETKLVTRPNRDYEELLQLPEEGLQNEVYPAFGSMSILIYEKVVLRSCQPTQLPIQ